MTVALPDAAVRDSRERIRAALQDCGCDIPPTRITVNLAPAEHQERTLGIRPARGHGDLGRMRRAHAQGRGGLPSGGRTAARRRGCAASAARCPSQWRRARGRSATLSCSKSTRGDELPEFPRNVLESCGTLENGTVSIASAAMSLTFPARFMLAAAMNPCPCGYPSRDCHLTQPMIQARCRRSPGRYSIASKSTSTFRRCDTRNCGPALPARALAIFANV